MKQTYETERFGMRIHPEEKKKLADLARNMRRSQSDMIRILINDAYLSLGDSNNQSRRKTSSLATMPKAAKV